MYSSNYMTSSNPNYNNYNLTQKSIISLPNLRFCIGNNYPSEFK
jgi:hypothetical protein